MNPDRDLNSAPKVRHTPMHMVPECVNHWATWAGNLCHLSQRFIPKIYYLFLEQVEDDFV